MYRVAILGCENSHANAFIECVLVKKEVADVEIVGVYSEEPEAAAKLHEKYGVAVASSYDAFVGQVDGIIITARNGKNHYPYALPYVKSGIPMFIDKPVTNSEEDAVALMRALKAGGNRFAGGSCLKYPQEIRDLAQVVASGSHGKIFGGFLRAPMDFESPYGGFYFYAQHLVQAMCVIFGSTPRSEIACRNGDVITVTVRYASLDVVLEFVNKNYNYFAYVSTEKEILGSSIAVSPAIPVEVRSFYELLKGGKQEENYTDFIAPVFIMNAILRSLESGREESVHEIGEI
jgi:predicted dehydrogenase